MLTRGALAIVACALAGSLHADPATAPYAGAQLEVAEAALARAEEARAQGDYRLARRLALAAQLDARLAWSMTDSAFLRGEAAEIGRAAERVLGAAATRPVLSARP